MFALQGCIRAALAAGILLASAAPAMAETLTGTFVRYQASGAGVANDNHITGLAGGSPFRGGIVFTVPAGETISAAEMSLFAGGANGGPNTLVLYEVTTSGATLLAAGGGAASYTDLGDGAVFGSQAGITNSQAFTISLNPAGLAAINAARGGTFALGLVNGTIETADDHLFGGTSGGDPRTIALTRTPPAPVPTMSEWAMVLLGAILAGGTALHLQRRRLTA